MAHWIISDRVSGGQCFKCSECGDSWCGDYNDHLSEDNCPGCGALIDHEDIEYIEKICEKVDVIPELHNLCKKARYQNLAQRSDRRKNLEGSY